MVKLLSRCSVILHVYTSVFRSLYEWCLVLKLSFISFGVLLCLQLPGCQIEEGFGFPATASGSNSSTCSQEIQQQLVSSVDILAERGFSGDQIAGFLVNAIERDEVNCPSEGPWKDRLVQRFGTTQASGILDAVVYDIHTGARYDMRNPAQVAKSLPDCYRSENVHSACSPKFHPRYPDPVLQEKLLESAEKVCWEDPQWGETCEYLVDTPKACLLNRNWKKFCKTPESWDGCWSFPRADLITAPPPRAVQSRIQLAAAKRLDVETVAEQVAPPQISSRRVSQTQGNYCADLDIF
mgnify:CR=1 FL=1